MRDYREDIKINRNELEKCLDNQAQLVLYWGEASAVAESRVKRIETKLLRLRAQIGKLLRNTSKERITSEIVTEKCTDNIIFTTLEDELNEAKEDRDILDIAVKAFNDRRSSLQALSSMFQSSYWATVPNEIYEEEKRRQGKYSEPDDEEHIERLKRIQKRKQDELS